MQENPGMDPFGILGATIHSTPEEAKASFRALALFAHPDKGGSPEEMKTLLKAYQFVMQQLNLVNRTNTVADLETEFAEFCKSQKDADIDLRSRELRELIMGEEATRTLEVEEEFRQKFNEAFEERLVSERGRDDEHEDETQVLIVDAFKIQKNREGYGEDMVSSEFASYSRTHTHGEYPKYKDILDQSYIELKPLKVAVGPSTAIVRSLQLGKYFGGHTLGQCASDYGEAFGPQEPLAPEPDMTGTLNERLERLKVERANIF